MTIFWITTLYALSWTGLCRSQDAELLVPSDCVKSANTDNLSAYPWFLPMHYDGHYRCGVVIVSNEVVLTAAHCVLSLRMDLIRIYMPDQTERRAVEVIIHEAYEAYHKNHDVAIIRLNQKIVFGQTMSPVCLPVNKQDPGGKTGRALGWLFHSTASQAANAVLQVNMTIYSHGDCTKMRFKPGSISGYMLCAGNVNRDICQDETSGPLVILNDGKWEIVGVTSWSEQCGKWGYPQVYAKMLHYVDWVCIKMRVMKVDNVECHCSLHRPMTCPSCGHGFVGDIVETEPDCMKNEQTAILARSAPFNR